MFIFLLALPKIISYTTTPFSESEDLSKDLVKKLRTYSLEGCVKTLVLALVLIGCLCIPGLIDAAESSSTVPSSAATTTPPLDVVTLKDGSVIYGEIVDMMDGELFIKTTFGVGDIVKVKWDSVAKLTVSHPLPFHLKEGTVLVGTAEEGEDGTMVVKAEPLAGGMIVPLNSVKSINPLIQPPVVYAGNLQGGYSQASGNSHVRNASLIGEFTGRSESLRLTILGRFIYSDDSGQLLVRNSRGTIKLDFFITKKFYWFASSYFEQDTFQDLQLRTALSSGPGYQFVDKGDYNSPLLKDLTLYAEAGLAYFNENFTTAPDKTSTRGRWAIKFNWPFWDDKVTLYHFQEGFPSLQDTNDIYITADTGVRFKIIAGFVSSFQWTIRYNSRPAAGTKDTDNMYLLTLGYAFDTSRKRS
jgi:putative salt-induced outer membrane protein YdiY